MQKDKTKEELAEEIKLLQKRIAELESLAGKQQQQQIRRLATVVRDSNDAITIQDFDGRITAWNRGAELMYGYSEKEALEMNIAHLTHPDRVAEQKEFTRRLIAGEAIASFETQRVTKNGRIVDVWLTVTKLVDDDRKSIGIVSTERDITKRKKAMQALRECHSQQKAIIDSTSDIAWLKDREGRFTVVNQSFARSCGFTAQEIVGKSDFDVWPRELAEKYRSDDEDVIRSGKIKRVEGRLIDNKGEARWIETIISPVVNERGEIVGTTGIARDITERKNAEESLKRSEERFRVLFEFAPDAYYLSDTNGTFIDGNVKAEDLSGFTKDELKGKDFLALEMLPADQFLKVAALFARNTIGQATGPDEFVLKRKDGTTVAVEIVTHPIKIQNKVIILGMARDITERKKSDVALKGAQDRLIQSEKMAAIGSFSAGIAHEVKNPLGVILSGAEFLQAKLPRYDLEATSTLEKIIDASMRANFVLQALLQFARPSEFKTQMVKPEDIVKPIVDLMMHRAHFSGITITSEIGVEPPAVPADANQIQQVVFNAMKNAMEAMAEGGTITVRTYKSFDKDLFRGKPAFFIEINDTGHGISKENLAKLFEPFFTTKEEGKGTGLGLFISNSIVENHGGKLLIDSVVDKGTSVRIVLPLGK